MLIILDPTDPAQAPNRKLKQRRRRRQRGHQKSNRATETGKTKTLHMHSAQSAGFVHFLAVVALLRCETSRISRFMEERNTETTIFFFFCQVG